MKARLGILSNSNGPNASFFEMNSLTMASTAIALAAFPGPADPVPDLATTVPFEAPKYGVTTKIPKAWTIAEHEQEDRVFVAIIPQEEFDRPGVAACELGLAPESLDDYRTRIDANAKKNGRPSGKLATNRLIKDARGERLETIWEFHPNAGGFWREVSVRTIANRQLYTFILNAEDSVYAKVRPAFDALIIATSFSPPEHRRRSAHEDLESMDSARVQVRSRPARRAGAPSWLPARSRFCSPTARRTASGPTISWCWPIRIARSTSRSWPNSCPKTSAGKTPTVRFSRARLSRKARSRLWRRSCEPAGARFR